MSNITNRNVYKVWVVNNDTNTITDLWDGPIEGAPVPSNLNYSAVENTRGIPVDPGFPYPPLVVTKRGFLDLFTMGELVAIEVAADTDAEVRVAKLYLDKAEGDYVDLESPTVIQFVGVLQSKGLLTITRANQVLGGEYQQ